MRESWKIIIAASSSVFGVSEEGEQAMPGDPPSVPQFSFLVSFIGFLRFRFSSADRLHCQRSLKNMATTSPMRMTFGVLSSVFCVFAGLIAIPTIGGASMCSLSITPRLILVHSLPIATGGLLFGALLPRKWFITPIFVGPLLLITTLELLHHEIDRFFAGVALAVVFLISSFLGAKLSTSSRNNSKC